MCDILHLKGYGQLEGCHRALLITKETKVYVTAKIGKSGKVKYNKRTGYRVGDFSKFDTYSGWKIDYIQRTGENLKEKIK